MFWRQQVMKRELEATSPHDRIRVQVLARKYTLASDDLPDALLSELELATRRVAKSEWFEPAIAEVVDGTVSFEELADAFDARVETVVHDVMDERGMKVVYLGGPEAERARQAAVADALKKQQAFKAEKEEARRTYLEALGAKQ